MSEKPKSLTEALLRVQRAIDKVERDGRNEHIKAGYPTLEGILDVLNPHLNENEIVVNQNPFNIGGMWVLRTTIRFASEADAFDTPLFGIEENRNKMQGLGSAITYARRYGLISYFKLSATKHSEETIRATNAQTEKVRQVKDAWEKTHGKEKGADVKKEFGNEKDFSRELAKDRVYLEDKSTPKIKNFAPQTTATTDWKFSFGKHLGKTVKDIGLKEAQNYLEWMDKQGQQKGEATRSAKAQELFTAIEAFKAQQTP